MEMSLKWYLIDPISVVICIYKMFPSSLKMFSYYLGGYPASARTWRSCWRPWGRSPGMNLKLLYYFFIDKRLKIIVLYEQLIKQYWGEHIFLSTYPFTRTYGNQKKLVLIGLYVNRYTQLSVLIVKWLINFLGAVNPRRTNWFPTIYSSKVRTFTI